MILEQNKLPLLDYLNEKQKQAVVSTKGAVLVLAGAGTGKTRVLTYRFAYLVLSGQSGLHQILAVTFTNKAAFEMKDRITKLINRPIEGLWLGTFHALAARILRNHAEIVGLEKKFTILDIDDQVRLLKQILSHENISEKKWPAKVLLSYIQRWKDRGLKPNMVSPEETKGLADGKLLDIYQLYQERLLALNACDFGDLLLHNLDIFQNHSDILKRYQHQFRYIMVDEYQDTNTAQYLWLRLLAQEHGNICCVGDDDQSIYGWRGAEITNILKFEKDFPNADVIRLENNYRSTGHILATASGLIAHNKARLGKILYTEAELGEKVQTVGVWDSQEEARQIGEEIEALQRHGQSLGDIAVLVRAGFQTREFEERFLTLGLKYRVIGGLRFYERQEIRDALSYLRLVHKSSDDLAFERIINVPKRGIGDTTLRHIYMLARLENISLMRAAEQLSKTDELKPAAARALENFLKDINRWQEKAAQLPHTEIAKIVLDESGYTNFWQANPSPDAPGRLENLRELITAMANFENLEQFLEHVSLVMENDNTELQDMLSIMTLHSAKGLEFNAVFLPGWEEGLFPHQRSLDENGIAGLEEERRLAYVGITRARQKAYVFFALNRRVHGQWQTSIPSRFIEELPTQNVDIKIQDQFYTPMYEHKEQHQTMVLADYQQAKKNKTIKGNFLIENPDIFENETGQYTTGMRVFHQKFGYGMVTMVEGNKLDIMFDKAGSKKVISNFVIPADKV
ncbi:MAG: UvrD-helicase domain-containing protein [Alphaproteobacteria bacterium]|nr:UvrD-helicase domain-containing protein [Alphaproteobacteria bacterium]